MSECLSSLVFELECLSPFFCYVFVVHFVGIGLGLAHNEESNQDDELPIIREDARPGMFTPRWKELHRIYDIERPRGELSEIVIHRMPREDRIFHLSTWDRHVVTSDLW